MKARRGRKKGKWMMTSHCSTGIQGNGLWPTQEGGSSPRFPKQPCWSAHGWTGEVRPPPLLACNLTPESARHLGDAIPPDAGVPDDHLVARLHQVGDAGLHAGMARAADHQGVLGVGLRREGDAGIRWWPCRPPCPRPLGLHRGRKRGKVEEEEPSSWEDRGVERTVGIGSSPCWGGPCSAAQCRWAGSVAPHAAKCSGRGVTAMGPS